MKKTNKSWYPAIVTIVIIGLIIYCFYENSKRNSLQTEITTLSEKIGKIVKGDSATIAQVSIAKYEEQSYIRQQDRDTTLILTCFAVVLAVFGVFSFQNFNHLLEITTNEVDEKIKEAFTKQRKANIAQQRKYNHIEHSLELFIVNTNNNMGTFYAHQADTNRVEQVYHNYLLFMLALVELDTTSYLILNKHQQKEKANIKIKNMIDVLNTAYLNLKDKSPVDMPADVRLIILDSLNQIRLVHNPEVDILLMKIFALTNIEPKQYEVSK